MQTSIKSFDLPLKCSPAGGCKNMTGAAQKGAEPQSDRLSGFMEIMGTLMALPPEQWENSLTKLAATSLDADLETIDSTSDPDQPDIPSSELVTLLLNLNGAIQKELPDMEMRDETDVLLNMAQAIMNDPQAIAPTSEEIGVEALKSKWINYYDRAILNIPADGAQDGDVNANLSNSLSAQSQILEPDDVSVVESAGSESKQPVPQEDPDLDSEPELDAVALQKEAPLEENAKKAAPHALPGESKSMRSEGKEPQIGIETSKPLEAAKLATDPPPSNSTSDDLHSNADGQSLDNGDDLDGQGLQKPAFPSGGPQGQLSRPESKSGQGVVPVTGEKDAVPQDKALQSDVIRQIVQRMAMHTQGGQSKMVIHLKPEYLGNVHMQVLTENHQVTVRMIADSLGVKEIVEQHLQHLRTEMQHHGLEIQKFDVFVANDNEGWKNGQEQAGFRESMRQRKQRFEGGKAKPNSPAEISGIGMKKPLGPGGLNEIDYFA